MTHTLAFASDHAGFTLKERLKQVVADQFPEWIVRDLGADSETSVDYPDFGFKAGSVVDSGEAERAIIVCGSGIGISIAANRFPGARAALCWSAESAMLSRQHNDANILALGSRLVSEETAISCLKAFLTTEFEGGRHQNRVEKLGKHQI